MRSTIIKFVAPAFAVASVLSMALPATADSQSSIERKLATELRGEFEVPGPGDPNGAGEFTGITTRDSDGDGQLCYTLATSKIANPTAAHIHNGLEGDSGPVVVELLAPTELGVSECIVAVANRFDTGPELGKRDLRGIRNNPDAFYVNVHNSEYPDGAIRGQLR